MSDVKPSNRKNEEDMADMGPWGIFRVANGETSAEKWAQDQRQVGLSIWVTNTELKQVSNSNKGQTWVHGSNKKGVQKVDEKR